MKERRSEKRRYLVAEVKGERIKGSQLFDAAVINFSEGGLGIYTNQPLDKGDAVSLTITVLVGGQCLVSEVIRGAVMWVHRVDRNFAAGIRFDKKVHKKDFPVLARCLEYAESNNT